MQESEKIRYIGITIFYVLVLFFIGHVGLVLLYKSSAVVRAVGGGLIALVAAVLLVVHPSGRFFSLAAGTLLWALFGEMAEHFGFFELASLKNGAFLLGVLPLTVILVRKIKKSDFYPTAAVLFVNVWFGHWIMVSLFNYFGKSNPVTYFSSLLFVGILIVAGFMYPHLKTQRRLTIFSVVVTCCSWSILEYLWAWKWIPKPW